MSQFNFTIVLTQDQAEYAHRVLQEIEDEEIVELEGDSIQPMEFEYKFADPVYNFRGGLQIVMDLEIYSDDEYGDTNKVATFLYHLVKRFPSLSSLGFTFSIFRGRGYDGGAIVVTPDGIRYIDGETWLYRTMFNIGKNEADVVVEIGGDDLPDGQAEVTKKPEWVTVTIIDHDGEQAGEGPRKEWYD